MLTIFKICNYIGCFIAIAVYFGMPAFWIALFFDIWLRNLAK